MKELKAEKILNHFLEKCYGRHKVGISEKYYPYILGAMSEYGHKKWDSGFFWGSAAGFTGSIILIIIHLL